MSTHTHMDDDGIIRITADDENIKNVLEFFRESRKELEKELERRIWQESKLAWLDYKLEKLRLQLREAEKCKR